MLEFIEQEQLIDIVGGIDTNAFAGIELFEPVDIDDIEIEPLDSVPIVPNNSPQDDDN